MNKAEGLKIVHYFLTENGWVDLGYDCGEYVSQDYKFKISATYDEEKEKFLVRTAILPIFDRWANSGSEHYFNIYKECIKFLKGEYAVSAFDEVNSMLEDEIEFDDGQIDKDAYDLISKMIELVTEWFEKE